MGRQSHDPAGHVTELPRIDLKRSWIRACLRSFGLSLDAGNAAADLNSIRSTIEGRIATELAGSPVLPVVFNNMAYEPTPNSSWVQCFTAFGNNEYLGHGQNSHNRIAGLILLNVFTPQVLDLARTM